MNTPTPNPSGIDLKEFREFAEQNTHTVSRFAAQLAVLYKFVDAALPRLSATQCKEVAVHFRQGVEDVLSISDDIALPAEYHAALLEQTNDLLSSLGARDNTPR